METNARYTIVGIFVIVMIGFIILGSIWLSVGLETEDFTYYKVYMKESVSGLSEDAPVEYNGVNVGNVTSIKINIHHPYLVELLLKIKSDTPITVGTRARLDVRALSGIAFILLVDNGANMTPLRAHEGQPYPIIATIPSFLVRLDTALTQLNSNFQQLSNSIKSLLNNENLNSIRVGLKNIQQITSTLSDQTVPATNQAITNIDNLTRDLSEISDEIKQNPAVLLRGKTNPRLGPGEQ
jgi:phospholipid/cholesterol/gamma-HCH transport system substrate-binding protein